MLFVSLKFLDFNFYLYVQLDSLFVWLPPFLMKKVIYCLYFLQVHLQSGDLFFLHSDPELAGSPPRRAPPVVSNQHHPIRSSYLASEQVALSGPEIGVNCQVSSSPNLSPTHNADILTVGLPMLRTGICFPLSCSMMSSPNPTRTRWK